MNENASRTVDAEVSAGAKVPFLATAGWVSVGAGVVLLAAGSAALVLGLRRPRDRAGAPDRPVATAAA
jgi:hypothetical protein